MGDGSEHPLKAVRANAGELIEVRDAACTDGVKQIIDEGSAVFYVGDASDPLVKDLADPHAAGRIGGNQIKACVPQLPGQNAVLKNAAGIASYDAIVSDGHLENLSDDIVFRDDFGGNGINPLNDRGIEHIRTKARSVIDIDVQKLSELFLREKAGSVKRKIGTLGVSSDVITKIRLHHAHQIGKRLLLCGNFLKGKHEILFPADKGIIGSAKSDECGISGDAKGHGGKLNLLLRIQNVLVVGHKERPEAPGCCCGACEFLILVMLLFPICNECADSAAVQKGLHDIAQGNDLSMGENTAHINVGKLAQDQIVQFGQRTFGKRKIAAPDDIIL